MKLLPFKKEHLDIQNESLLASGYILEKYGATYENSFAGTFFTDDGEPIISFGLYILWPGVSEVWTFPRPIIKEHGLAVTKSIKKLLQSYVNAMDIWRLQARCVTNDEVAFRWLEFFGFKLEAKLHKYGPDGKDYYLLAIVRE